jgi:Mn2+/Fe2+ NRAMP family transporter
MLQLTNRADLMGPYKNSRIFNIIAWVTCIVMIVLTALLAVTSLMPGKLPS